MSVPISLQWAAFGAVHLVVTFKAVIILTTRQKYYVIHVQQYVATWTITEELHM